MSLGNTRPLQLFIFVPSAEFKRHPVRLQHALTLHEIKLRIEIIGV